MKKKKLRKKSPTFYRKRCVKWAKDEAKERDGWRCQKCGKKVEGMNAHGSHIYNEGTYRSMSADTDNILTFCYHCHIYWWHRSPLDASAWFNAKYPELRITLLLRSQVLKGVNWEKRYEEIKQSILKETKGVEW